MAPDPYVQHDWSTMTWVLMLVVMIFAVSVAVGIFLYATARIDAQSGGQDPDAEPQPELSPRPDVPEAVAVPAS